MNHYQTGELKMQHHQLEALVDARLRNLNLICVAITGSVLVYGAVAWFLFARAGYAPSGAIHDVPFLPYILAAAGVGALVIAPLISAAILRQGLSHVARTDPTAALNAVQTSVIVGFAVREAAAVIGLVITLLSGSMTWVVVLGAAAVASMLAAWPRKEKLLAAADGRPQPIA
jgi:hypothetical protein